MSLPAIQYTSPSSASPGLHFAQNALDLMVYMALRSQLHYDAVADVKPTNQSFPGASVTFTMMNDLAISTTALSEATDVTAVALSNAQMVLTIQEFGNAVVTTALGRGTSWTDLDSVVTNVLGYNAGVSLDAMAQITLQQYAVGPTPTFAPGLLFGTGPTNVGTATTLATMTAGTGSSLNPQNIRAAVANLRSNFAPDFGGYYIGFIHPDVSYDLRNTTGTNNWSDPHAYSAPENIWNGEIGAFGGVKFIETGRAPAFSGAGGSGAGSGTNIPYFSTIILGRQALAKAYSYVDGNGDYPSLVAGPVTDKLRRLVPFGWYWLGGYGLFRQQSMVNILSTSTLTAANATQSGVVGPNPAAPSGISPGPEFSSPQSGPTVPGETRTAS